MSQETGSERAAVYSVPERLTSIFVAPAEQLVAERLLLYALVHGRRPARCLEIGTHWGGAASILAAALDDIGHGILVSVDPVPLVDEDTRRRIGSRWTLVPGPSPDVLGAARAAAAGPFDLVLVDGDHSYLGVMSDGEGILPHLAEGAFVLFHDAHYREVARAIDELVARYPDRLRDCGLLSVDRAPDADTPDGQPVAWGGLRLLLHGGGDGMSTARYDPLRQLEEEARACRAELARVRGSRSYRLAQRIVTSVPARLVRWGRRRRARSD